MFLPDALSAMPFPLPEEDGKLCPAALEEIWEKLCSVLDAFMGYFDKKVGLIPCLPTDKYWNFYEWSETMSGSLGKRSELRYEAPLNAFFVLALRAFSKISNVKYLNQLHNLCASIRPNESLTTCSTIIDTVVGTIFSTP